MDPRGPPNSDPRLRTLRHGQYDNPPASESSTPRSRRTRLHNALRVTSDMAGNELDEMGPSTFPSSSSRRAQLGPLQRRRQRSPIVGSPASDPRDVGSEDNRRRRPKRRKLDVESSLTPKQPIKYGYYGQVEPGRLALDIVSCDGGEHRDRLFPGIDLGPQNMLRHDKSVYCSDRPSSSILLRHSDDTPFCLEKLHIVGPESGFTAPVREGIVYVAMTIDDLKKYMDPPQHARIRGVNTPPYRRQRSFRPSEERITLSEALRDPEIDEGLDDRQRDFNNRRSLLDAPPPAHDSEHHYYREFAGFDSEDVEPQCEVPSGTEAENILVSADDGSLPVTLLSDEEPDQEESTSQEVLDFRQQRSRTMNSRRRFDADNWDADGRWNGTNSTTIGGDSNERESSWTLRHLDSMMARSRMDDSPRRADQHDDRAYTYDRRDPGRDPRIRHREERHFTNDQRDMNSPFPSDALLDGSERYDDGLNDPKVTRARFHIRNGKYKVAIRFDPPISGRFVLLKLWANRSNVDLQSVIAKGYGGCRFFGAVEMR